VTEAFRGFLQSLQANALIVPYTRPRPLPSTSFPIYYSLIILSLGAVWSELLKESLNKPQINNINETGRTYA
jgi:hypothetical protein